MLKRKSGRELMTDKVRAQLFVSALVIAVVVFSGWYIWNKVYESQNNVFWGMVSNDLNTTYLHKSFTVSSQGATLDKQVELQLGVRNVAYTTTTFTQPGGVVKTEELNTPTDDYIRYTQIKTDKKDSTGNPKNFNALLNYWGRSSIARNSSENFGNIYYQTLAGIFPFGNLNPEDRSSLVKLARTDNVYSFKESDTKRQALNGRLVYVYTVSVNQEGYINLINAFSKDMGLPLATGINPSDYKNAPAATFEVTVDASSRQLVTLNYKDGVQKENYSTFNLQQPNIPQLPKTTLPLDQLKAELNNIASD